MSVRVPASLLKSPERPATVIDDLDPQDPRWFAVRVGHRKEKVTAKLLKREGVEYFLPLREKPYSYESKTGVRKIPLLSGYIFVKIITGQALAVQRINYVFGFVKLGRERRQITEAEIDLLRRISTDSSLTWEVDEQLNVLVEGSPVEIRTGPLSGVRGYYLHQKNKKTFVISFGGLDARLTTCEVAPDNVIPLSGPPIQVDSRRNRGGKQLW